ncbi:MAG: ABC transporter substrate-binding protein [Chloroflexota bacterium]
MFRRPHALTESGPNSPGQRLALFLVAAIMVVAACAGGSGASPSPSTIASVAPAASVEATPLPTAAPSAAAFPVTLTDDEGTTVEIEAEPEVIVSLTPATTETLFALGVGDRVVGKGQDFFLYPPEAVDIPDVATFDAVDIEQVVSLEPDLVFAGGNFFTPPDAITRMRELGLPVVVLYAASVEAVFADIELIGQASGRSAEATAIVERMRTEFDAVEAAVAGLATPRLFYELDATGAIYGPADDSFLAEMIELAGGDPITTGSADKFDISVERLIEEDPELILLADAPFGVTPEQVAARPGWNVMTAVQEGEIRPIDDQTVTRPGPRLFLGLRLLAETIHPGVALPAAAPIPPVR